MYGICCLIHSSPHEIYSPDSCDSYEDVEDKVSSYVCPFYEITFKTEDEIMVHVDTH